MSIKFKDVAHHYVGCEVVAPLSFYKGFSTKLVAANHSTSFRNGIELQSVISGQFADLKPVLIPLEDMTDEVFDRDYAKFEQLERDCVGRKDSVKCIAAMFSQMCKDGFDVFGLIESNEAIAKNKS